MLMQCPSNSRSRSLPFLTLSLFFPKNLLFFLYYYYYYYYYYSLYNTIIKKFLTPFYQPQTAFSSPPPYSPATNKGGESQG